MSENVTTRLMTESDVDAVAAIYAANARDNLTPEQRAKHGFVQGKMTPDRLRAAAKSEEGVVVTVGDEVAGVALTHPVERFATASGEEPSSPAAHAVIAANEAGIERPLMYGPAVVAADFRGRGLARKLTEAVWAQAQERGYHNMLAFIEDENTASAGTHEALGWKRFKDFSFRGRKFGAYRYNGEVA